MSSGWVPGYLVQFEFGLGTVSNLASLLPTCVRILNLGSY
jgi:hypothetical protein